MHGPPGNMQGKMQSSVLGFHKGDIAQETIQEKPQITYLSITHDPSTRQTNVFYNSPWNLPGGVLNTHHTPMWAETEAPSLMFSNGVQT